MVASGEVAYSKVAFNSTASLVHALPSAPSGSHCPASAAGPGQRTCARRWWPAARCASGAAASRATAATLQMGQGWAGKVDPLGPRGEGSCSSSGGSTSSSGSAGSGKRRLWRLWWRQRQPFILARSPPAPPTSRLTAARAGARARGRGAAAPGGGPAAAARAARAASPPPAPAAARCVQERGHGSRVSAQPATLHPAQQLQQAATAAACHHRLTEHMQHRACTCTPRGTPPRRPGWPAGRGRGEAWRPAGPRTRGCCAGGGEARVAEDGGTRRAGRRLRRARSAGVHFRASMGPPATVQALLAAHRSFT